MAALELGRPSEFSQETADAICERIADGESLRSICLNRDMPNKATVFRWLAKHADFCDQYARARQVQADALFDEILDIADNGGNDWMERKGDDGVSLGWRENGEALRRSALRVDARKWMAGKLQPKKYGDKFLHDHTHTIDIDEARARFAEIMAKCSIPAPSTD
jgi:hypothetical protein